MNQTDADIIVYNAARILDVFGVSVLKQYKSLVGPDLPKKLSLTPYLHRHFHKINIYELWRLNSRVMNSCWEALEDREFFYDDLKPFDNSGLGVVDLYFSPVCFLDYFSDLTMKLKIYQKIALERGRKRFELRFEKDPCHYLGSHICVDSFNHHVQNPKKNCVYYGYFDTLVKLNAKEYKPLLAFYLREMDPDEVACEFFWNRYENTDPECWIGTHFSVEKRVKLILGLSQCLRSSGIKYLIIERRRRFGPDEIVIDNFESKSVKLNKLVGQRY